MEAEAKVGGAGSHAFFGPCHQGCPLVRETASLASSSPVITAWPSRRVFSVQAHLLLQGRAACKGGLQGAPAPPVLGGKPLVLGWGC